MKNRLNTRKLCISALIAAIYVALTIALAPISYGALQFRVSESLCVFPYFIPGTAWGLFAGCIIANLMTGNIFDVIFGSAATLIASLLTALIGKRRNTVRNRALACFIPVIVNAIVVSAVITFAYNGNGSLKLYLINALQIAAGEAGVMYILGLPLMKVVPKIKIISDIIKENKYEGS